MEKSPYLEARAISPRKAQLIRAIRAILGDYILNH
jgi:hypothetical protein